VDLDVIFLSRLQFALTIMFHYLFPPLTIGMGVVLVYLEQAEDRGQALRREHAIKRMSRADKEALSLNRS